MADTVAAVEPTTTPPWASSTTSTSNTRPCPAATVRTVRRSEEDCWKCPVACSLQYATMYTSPLSSLSVCLSLCLALALLSISVLFLSLPLPSLLFACLIVLLSVCQILGPARCCMPVATSTNKPLTHLQASCRAMYLQQAARRFSSKCCCLSGREEGNTHNSFVRRLSR